MSNAVIIKNAVKKYGDFIALKGVSLDIKEGEFFTLLGPSGCGKTTLLRMIAGFNSIEGGEFYFGDRLINTVPAHKRDIGMVFQNYAIFPHLTVEENVAYGLKARKVPKAEIQPRVKEALELVQISHLATRKPNELSGGQQQRVALARMLAARPGILMLDEPFSALDSHLKGVLEQNLVSLFDAFEGTILYVSHDIDEALRFCDRIAVVDAGHIMEIATGDSLVNHPQSRAAIKLSGCKNETDAVRMDDARVHCPKWGIDLGVMGPVAEDVRAVGVREFYIYAAEGPGENNYRMRVDRVSESRFELTVLLAFLDRDESDEETVVNRIEDEIKYLGQHLFWRTDKMAVPAAEWPQEGDELWIHIDPERVYVVEK